MSLAFPCLQIPNNLHFSALWIHCPIVWNSITWEGGSLGALGGRVSARVCSKWPPSQCWTGKECTFTDFLWMRACFFPLSVWFLCFRSGTSCPPVPAGSLVCSPWARGRGEPAVVHVPSLLSRFPLGTCPHMFPGEFETHAAPKSLAGFISLCLNPNRTGTHYLLSPH